jgi:hypothetical protein
MKVNRTGLKSCPMSSFGIRGVESSGFATIT